MGDRKSDSSADMAQMTTLERFEQRLARLEALVEALSLERADVIPGIIPIGLNQELPSNSLEAQIVMPHYENKQVEARSCDTSARNPAFLFRKVEDPENLKNGVTSELEIKDLDLILLLDEVIGRYPGVNFKASLVIISSPFAVLVHNWQKLVERAQDVPDAQPCKKLANLLAAVKATPELEDYFRIRDADAKSRTVTFETLWTLFAPETLVVARPFMNIQQVFRVIDTIRLSSRFFRIWAWHWDWDGKALIKVKYDLDIERFVGTRLVDDLPYQPLAYCSQAEAIKEYGISDAEAFLQFGIGRPLLGGLLGQPLTQSEELQSSFEDTIEFEDTVMMLDKHKGVDPNNDNFLLLPPRILGYATREKLWTQFLVDSVKPGGGKRPQKFREVLQLDETYKRLIESLVMSFSRNSDKQLADIIEGKGKGLYILLYGPPGVGKTLTAETIAEATGRPLFAVSVAEIGLNPSQAEQNFERLYRLATTWEAVLLLDDADIFLEARNPALGACRNALVTILLRVLEYFQGIIIMTTNRITGIDVAVLSRMSLCVRYKGLTPEQGEAIFKYFLDRIPPELIYERGSIDEFIKESDLWHGFNGRQIRNVVSTALSVAQYEAQNPSPLVSEELRRNAAGQLMHRHLNEICNMVQGSQRNLVYQVEKQQRRT
ncbi:hypothetical protein DL765_004203 [Monosporascus sp. GIB2]|nr:hypothetical protein DL765_004203 [Monosporascus sp. GIB2]